MEKKAAIPVLCAIAGVFLLVWEMLDPRESQSHFNQARVPQKTAQISHAPIHLSVNIPIFDPATTAEQDRNSVPGEFSQHIIEGADNRQVAQDSNPGEEIPFAPGDECRPFSEARFLSCDKAGICNRQNPDFMDPSQIGALQDLLESGRPEETKILAAYALAEIGNSEACSILIEQASQADGAGDCCLKALSRVHALYSQETLVQAAEDPVLPIEVRAVAVGALSHYNSARVETILMNLHIQNETPGPTTMPQEKKPSLLSEHTQTQLNNLQDEVWY